MNQKFLFMIFSLANVFPEMNTKLKLRQLCLANNKNKCFKWHFYSSGRTTRQEILKSMHRCRSNGSDSTIYGHFIIWPSSVTLTFNLPEQMFQMALLLLNENKLCQIILKSMQKEFMGWKSSIYDHLIIWPLKYDRDLRPTWTNVSNGINENKCPKTKSKHKCTSYCPDKSRWMHICTMCTQTMHIHQTEVVTTMSRSQKAGQQQNGETIWKCT